MFSSSIYLHFSLSIFGLITSIWLVYYTHQTGNKDARFAWIMCALYAISDIARNLNNI